MFEMNTPNLIERLAELRKNSRSGENSDVPEAYYSDDLIAIYTLFKNEVYDAQSVLYPACGFDASPARVFSDVTFVDSESRGNEGCVERLKEKGHTALKKDIKLYKPKKEHDLLILLNPSIPTEWASRHLVKGGWVIANDYHGNASEMHEDREGFTLYGTIDFVERDRRKDDNTVVLSTDLEGLFQPVVDAEEFKKLRPEDFELTQGMVESYAEAGLIRVDPRAPFDKKWALYREALMQNMPYKREADRYIFTKNELPDHILKAGFKRVLDFAQRRLETRYSGIFKKLRS